MDYFSNKKKTLDFKKRFIFLKYPCCLMIDRLMTLKMYIFPESDYRRKNDLKTVHAKF